MQKPVINRLGSMFQSDLPPVKNGLWIGRLTKLGSMFEQPEEPAAVATVETPVEQTQQVQADDEMMLKQEIRDLAQRKEDPQAVARLQAIRNREYARSDGGRIGIKRTLAGVAGLGRA